MKHKVHWLIDGLIEIDAQNSEDAEKIIKDKIEAFIKSNSTFFEEVGAKMSKEWADRAGSRGQAVLAAFK